MVLILRTHGREQQHFLNVVGVCQEHSQSIQSKTPSTSRRQSVLQTLAERLVNQLSFIVTGSLVSGLLLESLALINWVIQLGVSIANLFGGYKALEALTHANDGTMLLCQR